jgi:protein-L-isoaspartate O-methyltransferase
MYKFSYDSTLITPRVRAAAKQLGEKEKETKLPLIIPQSHAGMISYLGTFQSEFPDKLSSKILDCITTIRRDTFFNWNSYSLEDKEKFVSPYTFMAHPFYNRQTVPSVHQTLLRLSELDITNKDLSILEIGGKSGYDTVIIGKIISDKSTLTVIEEDTNLKKICTEKHLKWGLEEKIDLISSLSETNSGSFDRISSTRGFTTQEQVYSLLDKLNENGILRISLGRLSNVTKPLESGFWLPWLGDLSEEDLTIKDSYRNMIRTSNYTFKKEEGNNISFAFYEQPGLSPLVDK